MAHYPEKTSGNIIEDAKFGDNLNIVDYYWNLKQDFYLNSQFKTIKCSSGESTSSIGSASSSDLLDDDASSTHLPLETHLLHEFSEPMASQLPIR